MVYFHPASGKRKYCHQLRTWLCGAGGRAGMSPGLFLRPHLYLKGRWMGSRPLSPKKFGPGAPEALYLLMC